MGLLTTLHIARKCAVFFRFAPGEPCLLCPTAGHQGGGGGGVFRCCAGRRDAQSSPRSLRVKKAPELRPAAAVDGRLQSATTCGCCVDAAHGTLWTRHAQYTHTHMFARQCSVLPSPPPPGRWRPGGLHSLTADLSMDGAVPWPHATFGALCLTRQHSAPNTTPKSLIIDNRGSPLALTPHFLIRAPQIEKPELHPKNN